MSGPIDASGSLAEGLSKAAKLVNKASDQLGEASDKIGAFKDELDGALMSDDLANDHETMIGNDPEGLAVSLSGPVALDRKPVYPDPQLRFGHGAVLRFCRCGWAPDVLAAMMKVSVDDELINELIPRAPARDLPGPLPVLWRSGPAAGDTRCAGDILFFGIQCDNPLQFVLAGWVASLVFSNIVYTLTVSFGDIGRHSPSCCWLCRSAVRAVRSPSR